MNEKKSDGYGVSAIQKCKKFTDTYLVFKNKLYISDSENIGDMGFSQFVTRNS